MQQIEQMLQGLYQRFPNREDFDREMEKLKPTAVPAFMDEESYENLRWTFFPRPDDFDESEAEEGVEASDFLHANSISLANMALHGWFDQGALDKCLKRELVEAHLHHGLKLNGVVRDDVIRNSAHILTRCNNPKDWVENKCGLVYGMVQSGKTNSMLALSCMAYDQGYDMVIVLTTNSVDLRQQTQNRFDAMFRSSNYEGGVHAPYTVISKTESTDKYPAVSPFEHFQGQNHGRLKHYLVLKKNPSVLESYGNRLEEYIKSLKKANKKVRALILDDEADHSSLNTKKIGESTVHGGITKLLNAFDFVDYIAYTATPQGCIAQNVEAKFGYPRDFIWVLDPFYPKNAEQQVMMGSYIGGYEFFSKFQDKTVAFIEEDDWPQHKLTNEGKYQGIYIPYEGVDDTKKSKLTDVEHAFLKDVLAGRVKMPPSLVRSLIEFIWTGCYRWLDAGADPTQLLETNEPLHTLVPHHAFMANISYITANQNLAGHVIARAWELAKREFEEQSELSLALGAKLKSHCHFFQAPVYSDAEVQAMSRPFIREVSREYWIRDKKGEPKLMDGFVYELNYSSDDVLNYASNDETHVKAAAIILGGNKLSRGLTVEGLAVSYYGRSQRTSLADTVTQMGRWFGHKNIPGKSYLHLLRVYMHRDSLRLFRDIAFEEVRFRSMLKDSVSSSESPLNTLYVMEQSPLFKLTNAQKGRQLEQGSLTDFRQNSAVYKRFSPSIDDLTDNYNHRNELFEELTGAYGAPQNVWNRGRMWEKVDIDLLLNFLERFKAGVSTGSSPEVLTAYLEYWKQSADSLRVNIVDMTADHKRPDRRRRNGVPADARPDNVPLFVECEFASLLGGSGDNSDYLSDSVIDFSEHAGRKVKDLQQRRDTPLFLLYRVDVNYLSKKLTLGPEHEGQGYIPFDKGALAYAMYFPHQNRPRSKSLHNASVAAQL